MPPILIHVSVVLLDEGSVCLVRDADGVNKGLWNLPGGHLESGEGLVSGAIREMAEETGINPSIVGVLRIYESIRGRDRHAVRFIFAASRNAGSSRGSLETRMFSLEELDELDDAELVNPVQLRDAVQRAVQGRGFPLAVFGE